MVQGKAELGLPHSGASHQLPLQDQVSVAKAHTEHPAQAQKGEATWVYCVGEAFQAVTTPAMYKAQGMCTVLGRSGPSSPIHTAPTFSTATPEHRYTRAGPPT